MSLLRRIEGARPGQPEQPQQPGAPGGQQPPKPPAEGPLSQSASPARDAQRDVRSRLQSRIINNLDPRLDLSDAKAVKSSIEEMFNKFIDEEGIVVTRVERQRMLEQIMDEILGFGPIQPLLNDDYIKFGTATAEMMEFLRACVEARLNMYISGGTGSGKTTLLNILSGFIPEDERIITIEDAAELKLVQDHVVRLESRAANIEGKGAVSIMGLGKNSLRMRPERIVVGETRGGEALSMLQAMNTGHDGSLSTGHANSPRDILARLETMCLMAGVELPARAIREQI